MLIGRAEGASIIDLRVRTEYLTRERGHDDGAADRGFRSYRGYESRDTPPPYTHHRAAGGAIRTRMQKNILPNVTQSGAVRTIDGHDSRPYFR